MNSIRVQESCNVCFYVSIQYIYGYQPNFNIHTWHARAHTHTRAHAHNTNQPKSADSTTLGVDTPLHVENRSGMLSAAPSLSCASWAVQG